MKKSIKQGGRKGNTWSRKSIGSADKNIWWIIGINIWINIFDHEFRAPLFAYIVLHFEFKSSKWTLIWNSCLFGLDVIAIGFVLKQIWWHLIGIYFFFIESYSKFLFDFFYKQNINIENIWRKKPFSKTRKKEKKILWHSYCTLLGSIRKVIVARAHVMIYVARCFELQKDTW